MIASFPLSPEQSQKATLSVDLRQTPNRTSADAPLLYLGLRPRTSAPLDRDGLALLTNGRGGMSRLRLDLGKVRSNTDCALGANLAQGPRRPPCPRQTLARLGQC